jgi:peptide-methionine (S)-S-oxide reductase
LDIFWQSHDPTSKCGRQYRSAIWYFDDEQKRLAEESLAKVQAEIKGTIRTAVEPAKTFYDAEDYHQQYIAKQNGNCFLM